jgi:hypothetical protein
MIPAELERENHLFFTTQVPLLMDAFAFQGILGRARDLTQDIRPDDYSHNGFEAGYVGVTAPAAKVIWNEDIYVFEMVNALYDNFRLGADTGQANDRVSVLVKNRNFVFSITNYRTNDPRQGWIDATQDPLSVPSGQTMNRGVTIGLASQ